MVCIGSIHEKMTKNNYYDKVYKNCILPGWASYSGRWSRRNAKELYKQYWLQISSVPPHFLPLFCFRLVLLLTTQHHRTHARTHPLPLISKTKRKWTGKIMLNKKHIAPLFREKKMKKSGRFTIHEWATIQGFYSLQMKSVSFNQWQSYTVNHTPSFFHAESFVRLRRTHMSATHITDRLSSWWKRKKDTETHLHRFFIQKGLTQTTPKWRQMINGTKKKRAERMDKKSPSSHLRYIDVTPCSHKSARKLEALHRIFPQKNIHPLPS